MKRILFFIFSVSALWAGEPCKSLLADLVQISRQAHIDRVRAIDLRSGTREAMAQIVEQVVQKDSDFGKTVFDNQRLVTIIRNKASELGVKDPELMMTANPSEFLALGVLVNPSIRSRFAEEFLYLLRQSDTKLQFLTYKDSKLSTSAVMGDIGEDVYNEALVYVGKSKYGDTDIVLNNLNRIFSTTLAKYVLSPTQLSYKEVIDRLDFIEYNMNPNISRFVFEHLPEGDNAELKKLVSNGLLSINDFKRLENGHLVTSMGPSFKRYLKSSGKLKSKVLFPATLDATILFNTTMGAVLAVASSSPVIGGAQIAFAGGLSLLKRKRLNAAGIAKSDRPYYFAKALIEHFLRSQVVPIKDNLYPEDLIRVQKLTKDALDTHFGHLREMDRLKAMTIPYKKREFIGGLDAGSSKRVELLRKTNDYQNNIEEQTVSIGFGAPLQPPVHEEVVVSDEVILLSKFHERVANIKNKYADVIVKSEYGASIDELVDEMGRLKTAMKETEELKANSTSEKVIEQCEKDAEEQLSLIAEANEALDHYQYNLSQFSQRRGKITKAIKRVKEESEELGDINDR